LALPPSATLPAPTNNQQSYATVPPAGAATTTSNGLVTVKMPMINLTVTYNGGAVKPTRVTLRDACFDTWVPTISTASTKPTTGWLAYPGQPYGAGYTVCADYKYNSTSWRKNTATVNNTSFTATNGNLVTVAIPASTTSTYQGQC
jgi:hypothetical protein